MKAEEVVSGLELHVLVVNEVSGVIAYHHPHPTWEVEGGVYVDEEGVGFNKISGQNQLERGRLETKENMIGFYTLSTVHYDHSQSLEVRPVKGSNQFSQNLPNGQEATKVNSE